MKANVFLFDKHAGVLEKHGKGYTFSYQRDYLGPPLSMSLPLNEITYNSEMLFPFFKSLLPEGWLLKQYARSQKLDERDGFGLLINNGEDLLGAVSIKPITENE